MVTFCMSPLLVKLKLTLAVSEGMIWKLLLNWTNQMGSLGLMKPTGDGILIHSLIMPSVNDGW